MVEGGKTYRIKNVKGGTVLDLSAGDSRSVIGWENKDGDNQKWEIGYSSDHEAFSLKNRGSGKFLAIEGDHENGAKVIGIDEEVYGWDLPEWSGHNKIFWKGSNNVVDLSDHGNPENGTAVTIWSEWKGENQLWSFEEV